MADDSALNKNTIRALFCTIFLLFPVAAVFAIVAALQSFKKQNFAGVALGIVLFLVNGLFVPGAAYMVIYGRPPGLDACLKNQDSVVGPLRMIHYLQEEYHQKNGRYGSLEEISWGPRVNLKPYKYSIVYAKEDTFKAVAIGGGIMDGDEHSIDEQRIVKKVRDRCALRK